MDLRLYIFIDPRTAHKKRETLLELEGRNLNWSVLLQKKMTIVVRVLSIHARQASRLFDAIWFKVMEKPSDVNVIE